MQETVVSTKYWHRETDGRLQCDVCPRHCRLREGQRGLCYVRQRLDDEIKLVTYGRSSGFWLTPSVGQRPCVRRRRPRKKLALR